MESIITKFLKFFVFTLVFGCTTLCVFVKPDFENSNSILTLNSAYNGVPYTFEEANEIAILDDYKYSTNEYITSNVIDTFTGTVTAYGPDCAGCIGVTASGYKVAENVNGVITPLTVTYNDETFGELRVLAAATDKFPFGTVIRISGERIDGYIMGIVLDRGGAMNNAWAEGEVLIDVLFPTESSNDVYEFGRQRNVKFEVLRYGN